MSLKNTYESTLQQILNINNVKEIHDYVTEKLKAINKKISIEELKEIFKNLNFSQYESESHWYDSIYFSEDPDKLYISVLIDGAGGGNCWGSRAQSYNCQEPDSVYSSIQNCIISTLAAKNVVLSDNFSKLFENYTSKSDSGYYGNWEEYQILNISLESIYNCIEE